MRLPSGVGSGLIPQARVHFLEKSLLSLQTWLEDSRYCAYDPFDGLGSYLRPLAFGLKTPQQMLQQAIRRSPFNLRPVLGIGTHTSTKGMGFLASGYLKLYRLTQDQRCRSQAISALTWLTDHASKGHSGFCWGNAFDYISRGFYLPKGSPTLVWSALIGHQFLEAFRVLGDSRYLDVAKSVGSFITKDLGKIPQAQGICLSYICERETAVHNANLLGARFLAELFSETGDPALFDLAREAARYSALSQRPNGSWYYGEEAKFHWIDNWHTAYNLDSLLDFQRNSGSSEFETQMIKGLDFYVRHFFRADGAPRYYWDRDYRFDIQSCSQSIDTLTLFAGHLKRRDLMDLAGRIGVWTACHMQDQSGYFYLWKDRRFTNKTPTFHWGGTTMFHALAHFLLVLSDWDSTRSGRSL